MARVPYSRSRATQRALRPRTGSTEMRGDDAERKAGKKPEEMGEDIRALGGSEHREERERPREREPRAALPPPAPELQAAEQADRAEHRGRRADRRVVGAVEERVQQVARGACGEHEEDAEPGAEDTRDGLNDIYALQVLAAGTLDVPGPTAPPGVVFARPSPNPAHGAVSLRFTLPSAATVTTDSSSGTGRFHCPESVLPLQFQPNLG